MLLQRGYFYIEPYGVCEIASTKCEGHTKWFYAGVRLPAVAHSSLNNTPDPLRLANQSPDRSGTLLGHFTSHSSEVSFLLISTPRL